MANKITPLNVEITSPQGTSYKSIKSVSWKSIPGFAILTGRNGSGKTQFLELMAYSLTGTRPTPEALPVQVAITGTQYEVADVGYIPSAGRFSGSSSSSLANIPSIRQQAVGYLQNIHNARHDVAQAVKAHRAKKLFGNINVQGLSQTEIEELFPDDFSFAIDDIDVTLGIAHVFVSHRFKMLEALERGEPGIGKDGKKLGPAPWDVVNESLLAAGFPYESISPLGTKLADNYVFTLKDVQSGAEIQPYDLSSGEKTILQLILWLFTAGRDGLFPKIILLDEPDAHLHPSMTSQFLSVIHEVLVERYGVRVIMTTHSPSTVALAPSGSVFQMERNSPLIEEVTDRAEAISILTAGLVTVSKSTKYCFVEDSDDVLFYETLYEILTDQGPSRDSRALKLAPSIAFIAVSVGVGAGKIAGGCGVVRKWVDKLDAEPLSRTFVGIIDRDVGNQPTSRIFVLGRYSFENYLLDPINIYCAILIATGKNPVDSVDISSGDEHVIRTKSNSELQKIVDHICKAMAARNPNLSGTKTYQVEYTTGQKVDVPEWVVDHRGHDLLVAAQNAFGHSTIKPPHLLKSWRRTRLTTVELAKMLAEIQCT